MANCSNCKKKLGFFSSAFECSDQDCDKKYCEDCAKSKLVTCSACEYDFCIVHKDKHDCGKEELEEDEEESDEELEYYELIESKNKSLIRIECNDTDKYINCLNKVEELCAIGYKIIHIDSDNNVFYLSNRG